LSRATVPSGVISVMPQAWDIWTPKCFAYACWRLRGAAEPPIAIVRRDEMSKPSVSQSSLMAIHTVGTAPVKVTFSVWMSRQRSRGCGFGPAKI